MEKFTKIKKINEDNEILNRFPPDKNGQIHLGAINPNIMTTNNLTKITMENANYRVRIKDLQKYKNDVSKTFKILDNELVQINNHVEKNNQQSQQLLSQSLSQSLPIQLTSRLSSGLYTTGS